MMYKCAACKQKFETGRTDEEARAEQKANGFDKYECAVTCDDCFKKIMAGRSAEAAARGIAPQELDAALEAEAALTPEDKALLEDLRRCVEAEPLRTILREAFECHALGKEPTR